MVFWNSTKKMLNILDSSPINNLDKTPLAYVIVADEVFGMLENSMRPFDGKLLSYKHIFFNYRLTLAQRYIKCTFGVMCNKWHILHRLLDVNIDFSKYIVKEICVLYNYVRTRDNYSYKDKSFTALLSNLTRATIGCALQVADNVQARFMDYFTNEGIEL